MTVPKSVRSWVADAEAAYGDGMDVWFPQDFGWRELCADAPDLAARLGETWASSTAAAGKARLEEMAESAFRGAYVGGLALLAAFDAQAGPDEALDRLVAPLDANEEDAFGETLAEDLATVERLLNEQEPTGAPSPRALVAVELARSVRPAIRDLLEEGLAAGARTLSRLGASAVPMSKVLTGIVNVAVGMAGLRYAVAAEVDASRDRTALAVDPVAFEEALGASDDEAPKRRKTPAKSAIKDADGEDEESEDAEAEGEDEKEEGEESEEGEDDEDDDEGGEGDEEPKGDSESGDSDRFDEDEDTR